jgi:hypothetical protein
MGRKAILALSALLAISFMTAFTAYAASDFEGTWTVQGRKETKFDITLSADGKATSTHPKNMNGTWTEDGGTATIKWDTGWVTKISKDGDHYTKQSVTADGKAGTTSPAVKRQ